MPKRHTIAIAGAGVAGLALARGLALDGHTVEIFDQFEAPAPVGSGLVMQPVGLAALAALGLADAVRAKGARLTRMQGHEGATGRRVLDVTWDTRGAQTGLGIHRAALHDILLRGAIGAGVTLTTGARVTGRAGQRFALGAKRSAPFDLLVDASGAGSPLSPLRGRALPYGAIWGTVDWPQTALPMDELRQCYRRANRMAGVLPIGTLPGQTTPKAAVFWSLPRAQAAAWATTPNPAWRTDAIQLWPQVAPFLDSLADPRAMQGATYSHGVLRRPYAEGLVHIGDAAHRASPQLGQGANMALLDALALQRAIARGPLSEAPTRAHRARRNHIWLYHLMSAAFTPQYQSDSRVLPILRDHVLMPLSRMPPVPAVLGKLVRGDLADPLGELC